jgi:hypothetical protein
LKSTQKASARESGIAGASTGTLFASLISLMDEGGTKSVLLILAPPLAVAVAAIYGELVRVLAETVADWKISRQRRRAEKLVSMFRSDPEHNPETLKAASDQLETLKLLEVSITQRRVDAIVRSADVTY